MTNIANQYGGGDEYIPPIEPEQMKAQKNSALKLESKPKQSQPRPRAVELGTDKAREALMRKKEDLTQQTFQKINELILILATKLNKQTDEIEKQIAENINGVVIEDEELIMDDEDALQEVINYIQSEIEKINQTNQLETIQNTPSLNDLKKQAKQLAREVAEVLLKNKNGAVWNDLIGRINKAQTVDNVQSIIDALKEQKAEAEKSQPEKKEEAYIPGRSGAEEITEEEWNKELEKRKKSQTTTSTPEKATKSTTKTAPETNEGAQPATPEPAPTPDTKTQQQEKQRVETNLNKTREAFLRAYSDFVQTRRVRESIGVLKTKITHQEIADEKARTYKKEDNNEELETLRQAYANAIKAYTTLKIDKNGDEGNAQYQLRILEEEQQEIESARITALSEPQTGLFNKFKQHGASFMRGVIYISTAQYATKLVDKLLENKSAHVREVAKTTVKVSINTAVATAVLTGVGAVGSAMAGGYATMRFGRGLFVGLASVLAMGMLSRKHGQGRKEILSGNIDIQNLESQWQERYSKLESSKKQELIQKMLAGAVIGAGAFGYSYAEAQSGKAIEIIPITEQQTIEQPMVSETASVTLTQPIQPTQLQPLAEQLSSAQDTQAKQVILSTQKGLLTSMGAKVDGDNITIKLGEGNAPAILDQALRRIVVEEMPDSFLADHRFSAGEAAQVENVLANLRKALESGKNQFAGIDIKGIDYNKDTDTITITNYKEFKKTLLGDSLDGKAGLYGHADKATAKPGSQAIGYVDKTANSKWQEMMNKVAIDRATVGQSAQQITVDDFSTNQEVQTAKAQITVEQKSPSTPPDFNNISKAINESPQGQNTLFVNQLPDPDGPNGILQPLASEIIQQAGFNLSKPLSATDQTKLTYWNTHQNTLSSVDKAKSFFATYDAVHAGNVGHSLDTGTLDAFQKVYPIIEQGGGKTETQKALYQMTLPGAKPHDIDKFKTIFNENASFEYNAGKGKLTITFKEQDGDGALKTNGKLVIEKDGKFEAHKPNRLAIFGSDWFTHKDEELTELGFTKAVKQIKANLNAR